MRGSSGILSYVKTRRSFIKKINALEQKIITIGETLKHLDAPFKDPAHFDVEKYRAFFNEYCIAHKSTGCRYVVKSIELTTDYEGNSFWDTIYDYIDKNDPKTNNAYDCKLSLRRIMHILDNEGWEIVKR